MVRRVGLLLLASACAGGAVYPLDAGAGGGGERGGGGGGGGGGAGGGAVIGLPLTSACSTLNARRCDYYVRCGLLEDSDLARRDCAAWLLATWCGPSRWPARVDVGTLLYEPLQGQACADGFGTRLCADFETLPPPCAQLTRANLSVGQSCYDGYTECSDKLACRGAVCPRTCQGLGGVGGVCQRAADCQQALYCRPTVAATGAGTCTSPGQSGAQCGVDEPCAAGLQCIAGRCGVAPPEGSACATGGVCDALSWCRSTPDGGVCAARDSAGASCTDDVQCAAGLLCQGTCVSRVLLQPGERCSDRQSCPRGTTCVGATGAALGACVGPLTQGQECLASDDCVRPLACAAVDGGLQLACDRRQPNHAPCTLDRDCQLLSRCRAGVCTRLPLTGQSCVESGACVLGPCLADADGGALCAEKLGPGAKCQLDADCASGRCLAGSCLPACAP